MMIIIIIIIIMVIYRNYGDLTPVKVCAMLAVSSTCR